MNTYTVKRKDTLGSIAKNTLGDSSLYPLIAELNNIENPNHIKIGQVLIIPAEQGSDEDKSLRPESTPPTASSEQAQDLSIEQLQEIMPNATAHNIVRYIDGLNSQMRAFQVDTPLRQCHFIAQIAHESGSFNYNEENLNYSADALQSVFGKYFPTREKAEAYAYQPEKIGSLVYADRMGNGNEASQEGWEYRGRGLIQLTGKDNYGQYSEAMSIDFVADPNPVAKNPQYAVGAAAWYWDSRSLNGPADLDDIEEVTRRINGGLNGLEDRQEFLDRAKSILMAPVA